MEGPLDFERLIPGVRLYFPWTEPWRVPGWFCAYLKYRTNQMKSILTSLAVGTLLATIALGQGRPASARGSNWDNVKMLAPGTQIRVAAGASKPGALQQIQGTLESVAD